MRKNGVYGLLHGTKSIQTDYTLLEGTLFYNPPPKKKNLTGGWNRTLQRLARLRQLIEARSLRPRQRTAILTKLEQHEAKLADLASKYSVSFDYSRLPHDIDVCTAGGIW